MPSTTWIGRDCARSPRVSRVKICRCGSSAGALTGLPMSCFRKDAHEIHVRLRLPGLERSRALGEVLRRRARCARIPALRHLGRKRDELDRVDRLGSVRAGRRSAGRALDLQAIQWRAGERGQRQHGGVVGEELARPSRPFMPRRSRTAELRKARPVCDCCTTRISTPPTCAIRMATNSPWSAGDTPPPMDSENGHSFRRYRALVSP